MQNFFLGCWRHKSKTWWLLDLVVQVAARVHRCRQLFQKALPITAKCVNYHETESYYLQSLHLTYPLTVGLFHLLCRPGLSEQDRVHVTMISKLPMQLVSLSDTWNLLKHEGSYEIANQIQNRLRSIDNIQKLIQTAEHKSIICKSLNVLLKIVYTSHW